MQLIGFVLLCIGIMVFFFAKRIVAGRIKAEASDERELRLLMSGAIIAVRLAGCVVGVIGLAFLAIGNTL